MKNLYTTVFYLKKYKKHSPDESFFFDVMVPLSNFFPLDDCFFFFTFGDSCKLSQLEFPSAL